MSCTLYFKKTLTVFIVDPCSSSDVKLTWLLTVSEFNKVFVVDQSTQRHIRLLNQ